MNKLLIVLICTILSYFYVRCLIKINRGTSPTPFLIASVSFLILNMIGSVFIAIGWTERPFKALEVEHGIYLCIHTFAAAFLFLISAWSVRKLHIKQISFYGENSNSFNNIFKYAIFLMGLFGIYIVILYTKQLQTVPIVVIFNIAENQDVNMLRNDATGSFTGKYWRYNIALSYILPFVSWFFLVQTNAYKGKKYDGFLFYTFFIISIFTSVITLQKSPVIYYLAFTYLIYMATRNRTINFQTIIKTGCVFLFILFFTYTYFAGVKGQGVFTPILLGLNRLFIGQAYPGLFYLDAFPKTMELLMGRGFPNPGGLLGYKPVMHSSEIFAYYFPQKAAMGLRGTMNAPYIMQGYANFGYFGLYMMPVLAGFLTMILSKIVDKITFAKIRLPIMAIVSIQCMKLAMTDFSNLIMNVPLFILIGLLILLIFFTQMLMLVVSTKKTLEGVMLPENPNIPSGS